MTTEGPPAAEAFVVGYGNPMRGDDGVGQEVAKALEEQAAEDQVLAGANITWAHQLLPEMSEDVHRAQLAVFIDAVQDHRDAGSVTLSSLAPPTRHPSEASFAGCWQDLSPSGLLALCRELYGSAPPGVMVRVSVGAMSAGFGLSAPVAAAVPLAVTAVRLVIAGGRPLPGEGSTGPGERWGHRPGRHGHA